MVSCQFALSSPLEGGTNRRKGKLSCLAARLSAYSQVEMQFEISRDDFAQTRFVDAESSPLQEGQARLRVDSFALTANNVTYAVIGHLLNYWNLFRASEDGWGRVPVMGFADVVESLHPEVAIGTRVFGFLPISSELVIEPGDVNPHGFDDLTATRREGTMPVYSHYEIVESGPSADRSREAQRSLLRGLFTTAFMIDDVIADNDGFGADTVVISSASSKTAIMTAHRLSAREGLRVVGLTGTGNIEFVKSLGVYSDVLSYDQAGAAPGEKAVCVDIACNADALNAVHTRFADNLMYSMSVGISNQTEAGFRAPPPPQQGPQPQMFFAKRTEDWGAAGLTERLEASWNQAVNFSDSWLEIERAQGRDAIEAAWNALLAGEVPANKGLILSP